MAESAFSFTVNLNIPKSVIREFFVGCANLEMAERRGRYGRRCPLRESFGECPMMNKGKELNITFDCNTKDFLSSVVNKLSEGSCTYDECKNVVLDAVNKYSEEESNSNEGIDLPKLISFFFESIEESRAKEEPKETDVSKIDEEVVKMDLEPGEEKKEETSIIEPIMKGFKPVYDEDTMEKIPQEPTSESSEVSTKGMNFMEVLGPMFQNMQSIFSGLEQGEGGSIFSQLSNMANNQNTEKKQKPKRKNKHRKQRKVIISDCDKPEEECEEPLEKCEEALEDCDECISDVCCSNICASEALDLEECADALECEEYDE